MGTEAQRLLVAETLSQKDCIIRILAERLKAKTQYSGSVEHIIASATVDAAARSRPCPTSMR